MLELEKALKTYKEVHDRDDVPPYEEHKKGIDTFLEKMSFLNEDEVYLIISNSSVQILHKKPWFNIYYDYFDGEEDNEESLVVWHEDTVTNSAFFPIDEMETKLKEKGLI